MESCLVKCWSKHISNIVFNYENAGHKGQFNEADDNIMIIMVLFFTIPQGWMTGKHIITTIICRFEGLIDQQGGH